MTLTHIFDWTDARIGSANETTGIAQPAQDDVLEHAGAEVLTELAALLCAYGLPMDGLTSR